MSFEEKIAAFGRKLDAKKSRLDEEVKARKKARQETREEIAAEIDRLDAAFDEFEAAMDAQLDKQMDKFEAKVEKDIDDVNAALDLASGDKMLIRRSEMRTLMARFGEKSFFEIAYEKL